jgi:hypothetical protein
LHPLAAGQTCKFILWLDGMPTVSQNGTMTSIILRTIGYAFGVLAVYAISLDMTSPQQPSIVLGQFWYEHGSTSLQVTEAIVSRYIDPCGLIAPLGCEPFLWHPLIASTLGWPAALMFVFIMMFFLSIAYLWRGRGLRRISGRSLKRSGQR